MPRSGVTYSEQLEWIFAAVWANYQPTEFWELEGELQSEIVAAYQAHIQIEAVLAHDQAEKSRHAASKGKK